MKRRTLYYLLTLTTFGILLLLLRLFFRNVGFVSEGASQHVRFSYPPLFFFIWNIFLAWIPYIISLKIKCQRAINWQSLGLSFMCLLFLPNAPYLITDLMHMRVRPPVPVWYDAILFFLFTGLGLMLGFFAMRNLSVFWRRFLSRNVHTVLIAGLWLLCSLGIYIGREGRWNSWDLFTRPLDLMEYVFHLFYSPAELFPVTIFTVVFTLFLCLGYWGMDHLMISRASIDSKK